jgi:hypothetical protein
LIIIVGDPRDRPYVAMISMHCASRSLIFDGAHD